MVWFAQRLNQGRGWQGTGGVMHALTFVCMACAYMHDGVTVKGESDQGGVE